MGVVVVKSLTWSGHKLHGRCKVHGLDISIENRKGSVRRGVDKDGHEWKTKMHYAYGYIRGTVGKDKDHLDCYIGPDKKSCKVFIVHQNDPVTGEYDEDKVMLQFTSAEEAKAAYLKQYDRPGFFGSMHTTDIDTFKKVVLDKKNHGKKLVIRKSVSIGNAKRISAFNNHARRVADEIFGGYADLGLSSSERRLFDAKVQEKLAGTLADRDGKNVRNGTSEELDPISSKKTDKYDDRLEKLIERKYAPELEIGIKVEMEHTADPEEAKKIALDHLKEDYHYYSKLIAAGLVDEPEAIAEAKRLGLKKSVANKRTVAIDFDGVINSYTSGWKGPSETDAPVAGAALAINKLRDRGCKVIIYSTRAGSPEGTKAIVQYLSDIEVEPQGIEVTDKKPIADVYIDDRAITFDGDWPAMLKRVEAFKPWMEKSIRLVIPVLEKARKNPKLIPVKRAVTRDGKVFMMTVWVLPADAKKMQSGPAVQFDLFDQPPAAGGYQFDLFDQPQEAAPEAPEVKAAKEELQAVKEIVKTTDSAEEKDAAVARAINLASPETRNAVADAVAADFPEMAEEVKEEPYEFTPGKKTIRVGDAHGEIEVDDYTGVVPKKIGVFSPAKALEMERPSWIPDVDSKFFRDEQGRLPFFKLGENKYVVQVDRKRFILASVDVLAAVNDFYAKREKEYIKKQIAVDVAKRKLEATNWMLEHPGEDNYYYQKILDGGYKSRIKPFRVIGDNKMTWTQLGLIQGITGNKSQRDAWAVFHGQMSELKQKSSDMEIQLEDMRSTFAKGRETAYGESGVKRDLLDSHGVKVKRQNGDEITTQEIEQIKAALDSVFSAFGDRSSMARKYGLKISHSGDKLMHARRALGIYFPYYKAIGVTAQLGDAHMGFILSHEWAHFMDNYLGGKTYHYASDEQGSSAHAIAKTFRSSMMKAQTSDYQNRTCECFARAFEEYYSIKSGDSAALQEYRSGQGNYVDPEKFKTQIAPMIEEFLKEKSEMLKSMNVWMFQQ